LAPVALAAVVGAIVMVVMIAPASSGPQRRPAHSPTTPVLHLPPYLTVRPGDTSTKIAERTGLTIAQLETFNLNPRLKPSTLQPGDLVTLQR
jgi:hypothetical protein